MTLNLLRLTKRRAFFLLPRVVLGAWDGCGPQFMWVWAGMLFLLGGVLVFMIVWIARLLSDS